MQWLHVMPALLEIVRDAEDDLAAMSGACQWLVRHAGATKPSSSMARTSGGWRARAGRERTGCASPSVPEVRPAVAPPAAE